MYSQEFQDLRSTDLRDGGGKMVQCGSGDDGCEGQLNRDGRDDLHDGSMA
jgi:hypothetical protein